MTEKQQEQKEETKKNTERIKIRLIPIWLRVVLVIVLSIFSLLIGVVFGYGVIGDGHPIDAFKKSTWTHIIDLVKKEK